MSKFWNEKIEPTTEVAKEILGIPYQPTNVRQINMLLRQLPEKQLHMRDPFRKLIPYFCLGLLTNYFDALRKSVCSILAELAGSSDNETIIFDVALKWLQTPAKPYPNKSTDSLQAAKGQLTDFQCPNVLSVRALFKSIDGKYDDPQGALEKQFRQDHHIEPLQAAISGRELALQVFQSMPKFSEKRSRFLVPVFLSAWSSQTEDAASPDSNESTTSRTLSPPFSEDEWTFLDRKSFLELIAHFQNPNVLYRAAEVQTTIVRLLKNGNPAIQRVALKALLNWKDPVLRQQEEVLFGLLDEKNYSDNVEKLLGATSVHSDDREVLMQVFLRLLYGQMIGRPGTFGSQELKRKATLPISSEARRPGHLEVLKYLSWFNVYR